jgi:hypothetical protein
MIKKLIAALIVLAMLAATVPMSYADTVNNKHYNGWIGADSPLYGLKTGFQKLDVLLTFNNTEKFKKQMGLVEERFNETQDAFDNDNVGALDAALNEYSETVDGMNETFQALDDPNALEGMAPMLYHHQEVFYAMLDEIDDENFDPEWMDVQNRIMYANEEAIKMKNGMPFYYYNGEAYFIPPGLKKKIDSGIVNGSKGITNGSKVPPGLANKNYKSPVNGSKTWPWDDYPYATSTPKNNGKGNGNGNNKK